MNDDITMAQVKAGEDAVVERLRQKGLIPREDGTWTMPIPKRIYIAGCVTDGGRYAEAEYSKKFADAEDRLRAMGHHPVNPTTLNHNHQRRWQDYMIVALHAMLDCDEVLALPCWRRSRGATIEVILALQLQKHVTFEQ